MASNRQMTSSSTGTFYFAYGSNLSAHQMSLRLPHSPSSSVPVAIVRLVDFEWIICERGYANVVLSPKDSEPTLEGTDSESNTNTVWGVLYNMGAADEAVLDRYEGHDAVRNPNPVLNPDLETQSRNPYLQGQWDYNKWYVDVDVVKWLVDPVEFGLSASSSTIPSTTSTSTSTSASTSSSTMSTTIKTLIYVDEQRLKHGRINAEYIGRMNRGIRESVALGLPLAWVDAVMRQWIPAGVDVDDGDYVGTDRGFVESEATETSEMVRERVLRAREERANQNGNRLPN